MNNQANIGNFWDWLGTAAGNVNNALNDVAPVINTAKNTFGPAPTPNYTPGYTTTYPVAQQPVYYNNSQPANSNNTLLYIGLAAAAVVAIILLNKK